MTLKQTTEYYSNASPALVEDDSSYTEPFDEGRIDITKEVAEEDKHLVQPAGVGGAVLGFIFFGPILGTLIGFSSAYAVRNKNGAGNLARAVGELTASIQGKSDEIEEKHHYGEKTTKAINNFCDDDKERSIPFKTREFLVSSWLSVKKNQLLEKGVEGTGKGLEAIGRAFERLQGKSPAKTTEDLIFVTADEVAFEISDDIRSYTELVPAKTN